MGCAKKNIMDPWDGNNTTNQGTIFDFMRISQGSFSLKDLLPWLTFGLTLILFLRRR